VQGGIVPLACGEALAARLAGEERVLCVFLGDGTLGEGVVYESLNLAALWKLSVLFVVEDNGYAQTTPQALALAGTIDARFAAFGIPCTTLDAGDVLALHGAAQAEVCALRGGSGPRALHVRTYRLAPHSKGDDFRDPAELARARANDTLARHAVRLGAAEAEELVRTAHAHVSRALAAARAGAAALDPALDQVLAPARPRTIALPAATDGARTCERLNAALHAAFDADPRTFLTGEDVLDPYGGAFKVARGLSTRFPERVLTTPISEAALTGFAAGAALAGARPIAEIMFGDFTTLALDQLVNHAAKLRWTYGGRARVPLVVRTPMGGRRGYGPTHSQSLERLFCGVAGLRVVCTSASWDAADTLLTCLAQEDPLLLVENKSAYGKAELALPATHVRVAPAAPLGAITFTPRTGRADVTLAVHGGMDELALAALVELAAEEVVCELVFAQQISPLAPYFDAVAASARRTRRVVVCEEGGVAFGVGAELAARLAELPHEERPDVVRVGAADAPIPAARALEDAVLPGVRDITRAVERLLLGENT
jgi:2-oxoisovalerate dehydrogenase E1 component